MDQYEVRKYSGWNHHILTCILAHFFLWHLKIRLGKMFDIEGAIELVRLIQQKNHLVYLSHKKKRFRELILLD